MRCRKKREKDCLSSLLYQIAESDKKKIVFFVDIFALFQALSKTADRTPMAGIFSPHLDMVSRARISDQFSPDLCTP